MSATLSPRPSATLSQRLLAAARDTIPKVASRIRKVLGLVQALLQYNWQSRGSWAPEVALGGVPCRRLPEEEALVL